MDEPQTPVNMLTQMTRSMEEIEDALGEKREDRPHSSEMWAAIAALRRISETKDDIPPTELHGVMEILRSTSDKWVDPEGDPIGEPARHILEEIIHRLGLVLDEQVPQSVASRQNYEDLRLAQYCIRRKMWRDGLTSSAKPWWKRILRK